MNLKEAKVNVERSLAVFLEEELIEPEFADTAKLLLYAMNLGCTNIDKLAEASGLARDRFVRPRARRLREAGVWLKEGPVGFESLNGPVEHMSIEFVLHCLIADGLIKRVPGKVPESPGLVENPNVEHVPASGTGV
jgi:hypothetical protein